MKLLKSQLSEVTPTVAISTSVLSLLTQVTRLVQHSKARQETDRSRVSNKAGAKSKSNLEFLLIYFSAQIGHRRFPVPVLLSVSLFLTPDFHAV